MTIITIDNASFCPGSMLAETLVEKWGFQRLEDERIFARAAASCGIDADELRRLICGPMRWFTGKKESRFKYVAGLRVALSELLESDNQVVHGKVGYLIPPAVSHVLKVALVSTRADRLAQAEHTGLSLKKAEQTIDRDDEARAAWAELTVGREPWDPQLFDIVLPAHQLTLDEMAALVMENAGKPVVETTAESLGAWRDFQHAASVQAAFADRGHDVDIESKDGAVKVLIKKHTLFLERLRERLVEIAMDLPGVKAASAHPGPRYQEANLYLDVRAELPSKVLLVDDEKSFVQTLSKRLQNRNINSSVAYGGAEALNRVEQEEPDVMVLDLKMPGIDGMDVLRNVKTNNPKTEVIILTAHGSEAEERLAYQIGAFAYLQKPVDIGELTETMKRAYQKVQQNDNQTEQ
jgi:two-component system, OmpR family, response regulator CpxR